MVDERVLLATSEPGWLGAVREVLARLDTRAIAILENRVLGTPGSTLTLQELGDMFNMSRERVRQIEASTIKALRRDLENNDAVRRAISRVRALGPVFSIHDLEAALPSVAQQTLPIEVRLLLFVIGHYQVADGIITGPTLEHVLAEVLESARRHPVPVLEVRRKMTELGVRTDQQLRILDRRRDVRVVEGLVLPWEGSIGDKAVTVLSVRHQPMTAEEIHDQIGEGTLRTLKNYLGSERRFQRRGPRRWGLAEWGGESYKSIAAEMADELEELRDGMPIERLKRILDEKFGIVAASIEIMSVTHPMFVREGVWVRLRNTDEPYIPNTALEETRDCVVIRGSWAWRHTVTHDTLRGSGHIVPEAFAASLRLMPRTRFELTSPVGDIPLYWPSQSPGIGSLRRVTDGFCALEGDLIFVIPDNGRIEFDLVHLAELVAAAPERELLLRLGQTEEGDDWLRECAVAIGLPRHALADEVEDLLNVRGDREVLRLFQMVRRDTAIGES